MCNSKSSITRKSSKMVAERSNDTALWIPDTAGSRLEDNHFKPLSEFGIDAVVGWIQWLGVPMWA